MKFFAVFAAVLAIAAAAPTLTTQWTLHDLSEAIQNPATPALVRPYIEHALNTMMEQLFAGQHVESVVIPTPVGLLPIEAIVPPTPAGLTTQWTLHDLSEAIQNPATPAELLPFIEHALNTMMEQIFAGQHVESVVIPTPVGLLPIEAIVPPTPAGLTTQWTLHDLSEAIQNPATPAELLPYIEHALNTMMEQLFAGHHVDSIVIPTPVGLLPVEAIEAASPAAVMPVGVVEAPVAPVVVAEPTPAVINDASGSPLVQIIVNIKSQEVVAETPAAVESPVLVPSPVLVVDEAEQVPSPVIVVDEAEQVPSPVIIAPAPAPVVVPEPIVIAPENPIDVIAIGTPEANPIDLLQPMPVAVAGADGVLV